MFFSDYDIMQSLEKKNMIIDPFDIRSLRPTSYVLKLSEVFNELRVERDEIIDTTSLHNLRESTHVIVSNSIILAPFQFLLSRSLERIGLADDIGALITGLSHIARLGVFVEAAALIHSGFGEDEPRHIVLEIFSACPSKIHLYAGMPICHMLFFHVSRLGRVATHEGLKDAGSVVCEGYLGSRYNAFKSHLQAIEKTKG